jgi:hypothetical protein
MTIIKFSYRVLWVLVITFMAIFIDSVAYMVLTATATMLLVFARNVLTHAQYEVISRRQNQQLEQAAESAEEATHS